ncbi:MAG: DUF4886 domain-containing protein [Clostridia bacterium]|nr:DUF4886 domain-containing protein [Clostridia bacterium]
MKRFNKLISLILAILLAVCFVGCKETNTPPSSENASVNDTSSVISSVSSDVESNVSSDDTSSEAVSGNDNVVGQSKSIKVLAIGNSFSIDGMEYLWNVLHDAGYEEIVLGNLYIGGCSVGKHWKNIQSGEAAYVYLKNTYGEWLKIPDTPISFAITDHDWDIVTLQQNSGSSGKASTYGDIDNVFQYIKNQQPDAKIFWHMTWAYQQDTPSTAFANYDSNQLTMYNAITSAVEEKIVGNSYVDGIIPSGTAIQNVRTSYVGDIMTRDGNHLSYSHGRYTAAMTWFAALTGGDPDAITWVPTKYPELANDLPVIRQSVKDAIKTPLSYTQQATKK